MEKSNEVDELTKPVWSVVSFEKVEARGLIYDDAAATIDELDKRGIAGLCIVTDRVAGRLRTERKLRTSG
jgi:hypothetical protein